MLLLVFEYFYIIFFYFNYYAIYNIYFITLLLYYIINLDFVCIIYYIICMAINDHRQAFAFAIMHPQTMHHHLPNFGQITKVLE